MSQEGGSEAEDYLPTQRSSRTTSKSTLEGNLNIRIEGLSLDKGQSARRVLRPRN